MSVSSSIKWQASLIILSFEHVCFIPKPLHMPFLLPRILAPSWRTLCSHLDQAQMLLLIPCLYSAWYHHPGFSCVMICSFIYLVVFLHSLIPMTGRNLSILLIPVSSALRAIPSFEQTNEGMNENNSQSPSPYRGPGTAASVKIVLFKYSSIWDKPHEVDVDVLISLLLLKKKKT